LDKNITEIMRQKLSEKKQYPTNSWGRAYGEIL